MNIIYDKIKRKYFFTYICKQCGTEKTISVSSKKICREHKNICVTCRSKNTFSKPVTFKNLLTNQVISADSITSFCELTKLNLANLNARFHFAEVLKGNKLHYKGWGLDIPYSIDKEKVRVFNVTQIQRAIT